MLRYDLLNRTWRDADKAGVNVGATAAQPFSTVNAKQDSRAPPPVVAPLNPPAAPPATGQAKSWRPEGVPFCWQPKAAFERIEQTLERGPAASAKLLYLAMSRIASDERTPTFSKPIAYIASLASVERRTVERRLPDLERLGLLRVDRRWIEGTKARAPNIYTLTSVGRNLASPSQERLASQSRELATATKAHAVAVTKEGKITRGGPSDVAMRITREKQISALRQRERQLADDTSEPWQHRMYPERLQELAGVREQIAGLQKELGQ